MRPFHVKQRENGASSVFDKRAIVAWSLTKGLFSAQHLLSQKRKIISIFNQRSCIEAAVNKIAANLYTSETSNLDQFVRKVAFCCCSSYWFLAEIY